MQSKRVGVTSESILLNNSVCVCVCAHVDSAQHSPSRTPTSPRSDAKAGVHLGEKRRTSAPPIVDLQLQMQQHHPRVSLKEKSKENQLERNVHTNTDRDIDKSPVDIGRCVCVFY